MTAAPLLQPESVLRGQLTESGGTRHPYTSWCHEFREYLEVRLGWMVKRYCLCHDELLFWPRRDFH